MNYFGIRNGDFNEREVGKIAIAEFITMLNWTSLFQLALECLLPRDSLTLEQLEQLWDGEVEVLRDWGENRKNSH